jgi:hypothetical protein
VGAVCGGADCFLDVWIAIACCGQDGGRCAGVTFTAGITDGVHPQLADDVEHELDKRAQHRGQPELSCRWDYQSVCAFLRSCHGVNL